jgi:hypothetical protein
MHHLILPIQTPEKTKFNICSGTRLNKFFAAQRIGEKKEKKKKRYRSSV